ncbi:MAG: sugar kinase [Candidatus Krumholzibacteria bacterium]|nr:sugar kinase [Candidatus Krumholzibacteria bacterium]
MSLVIVGSVAFDTIETPRGRVDRAIGGSAVYSSMIASRFCEPKLVGVVGEDFTAQHKAILEERGVDIEGLETVSGGRTFFWEGRYGSDPNERDTIVTELNVFESFSPKLPESYLSAGFLFLGNIDPVLQLAVLEQFPVKPVTGIDTMNFWIEGKLDQLRRVLEKADLVFVNDSEARQLSGESNLLSAAESVLAMGPKVVVIKKGEHGAHLFTKGFQFIVPAFPLEDVLDPTGAGDTFAGGFMGYLASAGNMEHGTLKKAMIYGTVSASFTCEKFSVKRLENLEIEEITGRYNSLSDITRFDRE